jgi:rhodanese-related sulfurtransferase
MPVQTIAPQEVAKRQHDGNRPRIIDVRTPAEYAQLHAAGARLIPLDILDPASVIGECGDIGEPLYLICESGARAAAARERFLAAGFDNVRCIEGGTTAWDQAGLPVVRGAGPRVISLERQVRIAAGLLVLLGLITGWLIHFAGYYLSAFIGAGLIFAGVTDWCGMALLLARMPWNRAAPRCANGCAPSPPVRR